MAITDDQLRRARTIAAEVVATHSDRYVPLFEILDQELRRRNVHNRVAGGRPIQTYAEAQHAMFLVVQAAVS